MSGYLLVFEDFISSGACDRIMDNYCPFGHTQLIRGC